MQLTTIKLATLKKTQIQNMLCLGFMLAAICVCFYYLSYFSWQISSDDAFNFARAVERFSVLEFRPHFPGYPALIAAVHLFAIFTDDSVTALISYNVFSAGILSFASAYLLYQLTDKVSFAALLIVFMVLNPLLLGLVLSGLSDTPALIVHR